MTQNFQVSAIDRIDEDLRALVAIAHVEGYAFMDRLIEHWESGSNRFDRPGEQYFIVRKHGQLVAAGGLNRDPYCDKEGIGRVRHVYVAPDARRGGAGTALMVEILSAARGHFTLLRLRTTTDRGAAFYEALGFARSDATDASHVMQL
ncbi:MULTISPECIES: GNAT family N-acetyltransferase [unclassified Novosphingobium]|uniref:GNAT family N-acetyltransferase n=1 Tax=unclassified Novosphingobium TaxID=2644732 RepID=UPI0025D84531|nr:MULTISPECIES: GNAT family N-acetyltransferase [unclassified Novosphingobium]HQV04614.1 GNAT family N-acetyltransferase [Novosphingobium sp.]